MENFKIDHFKKDNLGGEFPWHRSLAIYDMDHIRSRLANTLQVNSESNLDLINALYAISLAVDKSNAEQDGFSLLELFNNVDISPLEKVYINWYRFDNIDEMRFVDLCEYFEAIWYPGADDIDIFDSTLSWILSVTHNGVVRVAKFGENRAQP